MKLVLDTNQVYDAGKEFFQQINPDFRKKGIVETSRILKFRYYSESLRTTGNIIFDKVSEKLVIKLGKNILFQHTLFDEVDVSKVSESLAKFLEVLEQFSLFKLIRRKSFIEELAEEFTSTDKQRLLQEDVEKVLLPMNVVSLDLYQQHPYFRLVLTRPLKGRSNFTDEFTSEFLHGKRIIYSHSKNIYIFSSIDKFELPEQKFVSIYYELFDNKVEFTKLPLLIFIPVVYVHSIYTVNEYTKSDFESLINLLGTKYLVVPESFVEFVMRFKLTKAVCIELNDTVLALPVPNVVKLQLNR